MMMIKNYTTTPKNLWTGRIDDLEDRNSFRMHQIINFIDLNSLDNLQFDETNLNICFLGFCSDEGVKRNLGRIGAKLGPEYIRKEFANLPVTFNKNTCIYDAGDISCVNENLEEAQEQLQYAIKILLDSQVFPIVLGGGHELALGHYYGIHDHLVQNNESIGIINFDAHLDLRPAQEKGSSGTMFSQIAEFCKNNDHSFNYLCLGTQLSGNTISLFKRADSLGATYIHAKDITESNLNSVSSQINEFIEKNNRIYLTLCTDVFNSAFAPGVSAMQPFGMNPETILHLLKEIIKTEKVISFDIAEVSPRFDQDNHTAKLAAVLIYGLINTLTEIHSF